jgi:excisionase family DNA binding protein
MSLYGVLLDVVTTLSQGWAISIAPHNTMVITQEAADLLDVSRPTLVRLLTDGEIPYTMRGRHRRVMLRDVLDCRDRTPRERRRTLARPSICWGLCLARSFDGNPDRAFHCPARSLDQGRHRLSSVAHLSPCRPRGLGR